MKKIFSAIALAACFCLTGTAQERRLLVLHTSDTHSCVEPVSKNFSDTAQADKGGFMRRATLVKQLRQQRPELLLLDCGDFSQGSAYYNLYRGEVEVALMNEMGYDACTLGNHEFDYGLQNLARHPAKRGESKFQKGGEFPLSHSPMLGVPGTLSRMSWKGVPSSCSVAARK